MSTATSFVLRRCRPAWIAALGVAVTISSSLPTANGQTVATEVDAPATDNLNLASFDKVWETVRDNHWEEDFGGVDWDQARRDLRPKAAAATTAAEARDVMNELIGRLKVSHFGIIPVDAYAAISEGQDEATGTGGEAGLTIRLRQQPADGRLCGNRIQRRSGGRAARMDASQGVRQDSQRTA